MDMLKNLLQQQQQQQQAQQQAPLGVPKVDPSMVGHAQRIWSMLDSMAESDPEEYKKFIDNQAKLYKEERAAAGPKQQQEPVLLLQAAKRAGPTATRVVISLWQDPTGKIPAASCGGGVPISASTSEWQDVDVRFTSRQPPFTTKKGDAPWEVVELNCHATVLQLAAAGTPPALRAVLAEATVRHVEALLKAPLDRRTLSLQVARQALQEDEVKAIEERIAGKALQKAAEETLGDAPAPSLLAQLSQLATAGTAKPAAPAKAQQAPRKPLIQEL